MTRRCEVFTETTKQEILAHHTSRIAAFLLACWLIMPTLGLAQSGVVSSNWDPLQIAQLDWNTQGQPPAFATGGNPQGVAFDGANIAAGASGYVVKSNASTDLIPALRKTVSEHMRT